MGPKLEGYQGTQGGFVSYCLYNGQEGNDF